MGLVEDDVLHGLHEVASSGPVAAGSAGPRAEQGGHSGMPRLRMSAVGALVLALAWVATATACTPRSQPHPPSVSQGLLPAAGEQTRSLQAGYIGPDSPSTRWTYNVKAWVFSTPAITRDGSAYFGVGPTRVARTGQPVMSELDTDRVREDDRFVALTPNGHVKWVRHLGRPRRPLDRSERDKTSSPAVGPDGTVYYGTRAGRLFALNPDGSTKWAVSTGPIVTPVLVDAATGTICVRGGSSRLFAFAASGKKLWVFSPRGGITAVSCGPRGRCYACVLKGRRVTVWVIDASGTARRFWSSSPPGWASVIASPDGTVYVADSLGLHALGSDGAEKWRFRAKGGVSLPVGVGGNTIYIGASAEGSLVALRPDGKTRWTRYLVGAAPRPLLADRRGTVYVLGLRGSYGGFASRLLAAFDRKGTLRWKRVVGLEEGSSVVLGPNRTLYFGCVNGKVYAVGQWQKGGDR